MLTKDNEYLQATAKSLYVANADEIVRQQCRAREDAERRERILERDKRLLEEKVSEQAVQLNEQAKQIARERRKVAELEALLKKEKK